MAGAVVAARRSRVSVLPSNAHVTFQPTFSEKTLSYRSDAESSGGSRQGRISDHREADLGDDTKRERLELFAKQFSPQDSMDMTPPVSWKDGWWIYSPCANALFGSAIVINAIYLGLETDLHNVVDNDEVWLYWFLADSAFLLVFTIELMLRVKAGRWAAFRDLWNVFDAILVSFGVLDTWIVQFVILRSSSSDLSFLTLLRVFRLVRLVRVLRILRLFRFVRELTLLAQGILSALLALGWSLLLILIVLYISAIFTTEIYSETDGQTSQSIHNWFGSLGSSFLTLFQLMTLENWHQVVGTILQQPGWGFSWLFFIPFIGLTNIVLLNVITGVVVERVLTCSAHNAASPEKVEMQQISTIRELHKLFESMDAAHTGSVSKHQFLACCGDPEVVNDFLQLGFLQQELEYLFSYMVSAPDDKVRICDLVDGCLRIRGTAQAKHLMKVQFDILRIGKQSREKLLDLNKQVLWIIGRVKRMDKKRRDMERLRQAQQQAAPASDYEEQQPPAALEAAAQATAAVLPVRSESAEPAAESSQAPVVLTHEIPPLAQPPQALRCPPPPAQAPPLLGQLQRRASSPLASPSREPAPSPSSRSQSPPLQHEEPKITPVEPSITAATWLRSKLEGLKAEQVVMGNLLKVFAGEMSELRATVLELKCPVPEKKNENEDEDSQSDSASSGCIF